MDYAIHNSLYDDGSGTIEQGRDVYEPAQMPFIQHIVSSAYDPYGIGFTKNIIIKSVSKTYGQGGTD